MAQGKRFDPLIMTDGLLTLKESAIQTYVEDCNVCEKEPTNNPCICLLRVFGSSMNDKVLNWECVRKMMPERVKRTGILII